MTFFIWLTIILIILYIWGLTISDEDYESQRKAVALYEARKKAAKANKRADQ